MKTQHCSGGGGPPSACCSCSPSAWFPAPPPLPPGCSPSPSLCSPAPARRILAPWRSLAVARVSAVSSARGFSDCQSRGRPPPGTQHSQLAAGAVLMSPSSHGPPKCCWQNTQEALAGRFACTSSWVSVTSLQTRRGPARLWAVFPPSLSGEQ